ncbi:hypothetical protein GEMRC1_003171 [Eukaryota sp. GEM-RC1]
MPDPLVAGKHYDCLPIERLSLFGNFLQNASHFTERNCVGARNVSQDDDTNKYSYLEYSFLTYYDFLKEVEKLSSLFHLLGLNNGDRVAIMSRTRLEWHMVALACYRMGIVTVPLFDNVPPTDTSHIINDSQSMIVFADPKTLESLLAVDLHQVRNIVLFDSNVVDEDFISQFKSQHLQFYNKYCTLLSDLMSQWTMKTVNAVAVSPDDLAHLVYTSGTTGRAKGVCLTHSNIMHSVYGLNERMPKPLKNKEQDILIGFLPLAHIFSFVLEHLMFSHGVCIGYYSGDMPLLTDDVQLLRPTLFVGVPRVFNKIIERIHKEVQKNSIKKNIFAAAINSKLTALSQGKGSSMRVKIEDKFVFSKISKMFGGRIRVLYSGAARLDPEIAMLTCAVFKAPIAEGYGLTETSAAGTVDFLPDIKHDHLSEHYGSVGYPTGLMEIKISPVPEMGYHLPQGEVLMKGPAVFKGYWNLPEKNREVFTEEGFYRTGDIGLIDEKGRLVIIDRMNDIVKGPHGEFINLSVLEGDYETCELVDQVFLIAGETPKLLAIVTPDVGRLEEVRSQLIQGDEDHINMYCDSIMQAFKDIAEEKGHRSIEQVCNMSLVLDKWTPESGLVTGTMKRRGKN